jgi:AAA+ superfamily predicted ATPase
MNQDPLTELDRNFLELGFRLGNVLDSIGSPPEEMPRHFRYARRAMSPVEIPPEAPPRDLLLETEPIRANMAEIRRVAQEQGCVLLWDKILSEYSLTAIEESILWLLLAADSKGEPEREITAILPALSTQAMDRILAGRALHRNAPLIKSKLVIHLENGRWHELQGYRIGEILLTRLTGQDYGVPEPSSNAAPCATYTDYLDLILKCCEARAGRYTERPRRLRRPPWALDDDDEDAEAQDKLCKLERALVVERESIRWNDAPLHRLARRERLDSPEIDALVFLALNGRDTIDDRPFFMFGGSDEPAGRPKTSGRLLLEVMGGTRAIRLDLRRYLYPEAKLRTSSLVHASGKAGHVEAVEFHVDEDLARYLLGHGDMDFIAKPGKAEPEATEAGGSLRCTRPTIKLADVVLPDAHRETIEMTISALKSGRSYLADWGLDKKIAYGTGPGLLFSGEPGTGKTLTAQAVAGELGWPLLTIDSSHLISHWVGMTQKHIAKVFQTARDDHEGKAVLFFDEADSLFYARDGASHVWEAQDVAVLLQEIERFDGCVILATNRKEALDEALIRRVAAVLEFDLPDEEAREAIWCGLLASCTRLGNVDFSGLAQAELSGGEIKKALLYAVRLVEHRQLKELSQDVLLEAVRSVVGDRWEDEPEVRGFGS